MTGILPILSDRRTEIFSRLALASPFIVSGLTKLADPNAAAAEVRAITDIDSAGLLSWLVIAVQLGGSALLFARLWSWLGAGLLAGFTVFATILAHAFWTMDGSARAQNLNIFFEHVAIAGGLLFLAVQDARSERHET